MDPDWHRDLTQNAIALALWSIFFLLALTVAGSLSIHVWNDNPTVPVVLQRDHLR